MFLLDDWLGLVTVSGAVLGTFGVGEVLRSRSRWATERTRKLAHIVVGTMIVFFPYLFKSVHTIGVLAASFALLLISTRLLGLMQSVHAVRRDTIGVYCYPFAVYGTALLTWDRPVLFQILILLLAFADGLAALVGKRYGRHKYSIGSGARTLEGSATVIGVSWIMTTALLAASGTTSFAMAVVIGLLLAGMTCAVEALSLYGLDNLLIPLIGAVYLSAITSWSHEQILWHLGASVIALAIATVCQLKGYLKLNGAVAAWLVGYVTLGFGGVAFFGPLLGFFLAINWVGKIAERLAGDRLPKNFERVEEKGSKRDYLQVFANAGVCMILTLAYAATHSEVLFWAYIGSLCAACADTFASEVGILSRSKPVLLWTFKPVPTGLSGGVTLFGYGAAALGSLVPVAVLAAVGSPHGFSIRTVIGAVACGVLGSTVDSLVGATLQAKRQCVECQKVLEKSEHCGLPTRAYSGVPYVSNDVVNAIGAAAGALIGIAVF